MSAFITITGGVGKDPDYKELANTKLCRISVASSSYDGKSKDYTTKWFSVEVWGQQCDYIMSKVCKGSKILVFGEYIQGFYTNKDNKQVEASYVKASKVEIIGEPKQPGNSKPANNSKPGESYNPPPPFNSDDIPF